MLTLLGSGRGSLATPLRASDCYREAVHNSQLPCLPFEIIGWLLGIYWNC